ncbi:hypothetical protein [Rhabdochromatium marinum]|uniref:hypothetical protein n=1 Tax=Rhabdochromatium marinum TaxID=48729 RepID=UPI001902C804|nr:hypothetical protein [Rhabdochromatium marinum]
MILKLPFKIALLVLAAVSAGVLWQQAQLMAMALTRIDPVPETRALLAEERYAEAGSYLSFFMDYEYVNQNPEARALYQQISEKRSSWNYQLNKLREGLFKGTSDEAIGKTAGVITDFFVIGDIRDLANQGLNLAQGEEVDKVLSALATLGLVASAAQFASGVGTVSTAGAATPAVAGTTVAKSGLIALKTARKIGKLPSWLGKAIIKAGKTAKQSKSLGALTGVLGDINTLAKTPGGFKLLGKAKDAADLKRMAKFANAFGPQSATIYRIGGNVAVGIAQNANKYGKETIKLATVFGKKGLKLLDNVGALKFTKRVSRMTKIGYKGDFFDLLAMLLLMLPKWLLYLFIVLGAIVWVPWRLFLKLKRWVQNSQTKPISQRANKPVSSKTPERPNMETSYKVTFKGEVLSGYKKIDVKSSLAKAL